MANRRSKTLAAASLTLQEIEPLTKNQVVAFDSENNLVLHGIAGTGKTFISCYLAFDDMIKGLYKQLIIIRSAVPTRDIGFLPGTEKEKASVYEDPYKNIAVAESQLHRCIHVRWIEKRISHWSKPIFEIYKYREIENDFGPCP